MKPYFPYDKSIHETASIVKGTAVIKYGWQTLLIGFLVPNPNSLSPSISLVPLIKSLSFPFQICHKNPSPPL